MSPAGLVRAAGGVVWQPSADGGVEVVLVHRPAYDDWTLPKGKVDPGESDEKAARREVEEETGLLCRLGPELASTSYTDAKGRPKIVRYWAMTVDTQTERLPDDEVDEWRWISLPSARRRLTYTRDRKVLRSLREVTRTPRD